MDLLHIFHQNIDLDTYKQLLREVFKADTLLNNAEQLPTISDDDKGYYIGCKRTSDRYNIGFFYYEIGRSNVARKKVGLRNLVHNFINSRDGQFDAAVVVFKDANHWRLSFICDIKDEATAPKRFTFVFGDADLLYKTALDRFGKLQQNGITFKNLQTAFSVEALNEDFFKDYKAHYEKFCQFLYGHADDTNYFGLEFAAWNSDEKTQKYLRDYVKNLLGRIVFLHFLQKKGWMGVPANSNEWKGGSQNFMYELFQKATPAQKEDFLDEVLENLFFNCLNKDRSADNDVYDTNVAAIGKVRIPYLNGELFEESLLDKPKSKFPVELFENLFSLFNSYNFTIDENDPSDAEIGVDPEMLGKIFENLLEDNKDKGAFYTPKEIVSYMCKESLIAYLQSKVGKAHHDSIRTLVNEHRKDKHLEENPNACERLNKALRDVKVCDPAIGSGAFPMGLLNEIFACRQELDLSGKPKDEIKGDIIQNNIYGVDIERGAVDIARLRFWLALVVDAEKPVPLPNLDYKIMQGNSLLESYRGVDLSNLMQSEDIFVQKKAEEVEKDIKAYFKAKSNDEKRKLRDQIDFDIKQCLYFAGFQENIEIPNTDFFLWHTYFRDVFSAKEKEDGGFDIVIGNPPYGLINKKQNKGDGVIVPNEILDIYKTSKFFTSAKGGMLNIFRLFVIHGGNLLKKNGIFCEIFPLAFTCDLSSAKLRKHIFTNYNIKKIEAFPERDNPRKRVFASAKISVCILLFERDKTDEASFELRINREPFVEQFKKSSTFTIKQIIDIDKKNYTIPLTELEDSKLIVKICSKSTPFSTYSKCYTGEIDMTFFKDAFTSNPLHSKVLRGAHVDRYIERKEISQGDTFYLDINKLNQIRPGFNLSLYSSPRILMQGITGVNEKIRLKMTLAKDTFCANSINYCTFEFIDDAKFMLGLFNSKVLNYVFKLLSTNSNVNGYEVDNLPIANNIPNDVKKRIINLVSQILEKKTLNLTSNTEPLEDDIDFLVFHLYGLNYDEVLTIYKCEEPPFSRVEYEAYKLQD